VNTYNSIKWFFLRFLGFIYLIAFWSSAVQIKALIGENGITPANEFLQGIKIQIPDWQAYYLCPTLAWFDASDTSLMILVVAGIVFSIMSMLGYIQRISFLLSWLLYLSIVNAGNVFMSFQWDSLLLETGFLAIFLAPNKLIERKNEIIPPSIFVIWLLRFLLFKLMFLSGAVKLVSGDESWRNLTALSYHWYTQPLPMPIAWLMEQLPASVNKFCTFTTLFIELFIPFFIFFGRKMRFMAFIILVLFQICIIATGNYTFFNLLTIALCLVLLDDMQLQKSINFILKIQFQNLEQQSKIIMRNTVANKIIGIALVLTVGLSSFNEVISTAFRITITPLALENMFIEPLRITGTYGLFAVMTKSRLEIIIEGSNDGSIWQAYKFKYKPQELNQAPAWVAPYQPRLDWQMWFAALSNYENNQWFVNFIMRLLQGQTDVLALLDKNPFPDKAPKYIRAVSYNYYFTDFNTLMKTGNWWRREYVGIYLPPLSLAK
jgi:hypothetical protein